MSRTIWATALTVSAVALAVFAAALMPGVALAAGGSSAVHAQPQTHRATVLGLGSGLSTPSRAVQSLQTKLTAGGFTPGPVDGRFGPMTEAAVQRFQQADGLADDGIVGPHTRRGLGAGALLPGAGSTEPAGSTAVKRLQRRLERSGFSPGAADGRYGPRTAAAVKRFQHARHIAASGIASAPTLRALANHASRPALHPAPPPKRSPAPAKPKAKHNPTNTNPAPAPAQPVVHEPSSIPWTILLLLGALAIVALAVFAVGTRRPKRRVAEPQTVAPQADEPPVTAAQAVSRDPSSSAVQAAAVQAAVAMPSAGSSATSGNNGTVDMPAPLVVDEPEPSGEWVERVKALQRQTWLGFYPGLVDGRYGPRTTEAVKRFQRARHLPDDGIADQATLEALHGQKPTQQPFMRREERVKELQHQLGALGLEPGPVDGRYGPITTDAVRRFQGAHALPVDGVADPITLSALKAGVKGSQFIVRTEWVKELQRQLHRLGLEPGMVDGRYGPLTTQAVKRFQEAVKRFQEAHNLPADGIADPDTLGRIRQDKPQRADQRGTPEIAEMARTATLALKRQAERPTAATEKRGGPGGL